MQYRTKPTRIGNLLTAPFLWLPLPFFIILDIVIELYHHICFPAYRIPLVERSKYVIVRDRAKLQYLSGWEKLGCMYCGYANGLLAYMVVIAGKTEQYWCGIMHENKPGRNVQPHQQNLEFVEFGNEKELKEKYGE